MSSILYIYFTLGVVEPKLENRDTTPKIRQSQFAQVKSLVHTGILQKIPGSQTCCILGVVFPYSNFGRITPRAKKLKRLMIQVTYVISPVHGEFCVNIFIIILQMDVMNIIKHFQSKGMKRGFNIYARLHCNIIRNIPYIPQCADDGMISIMYENTARRD